MTEAGQTSNSSNMNFNLHIRSNANLNANAALVPETSRVVTVPQMTGLLLLMKLFLYNA